MHDQRVGGRNVEAEFDDRGREQDVVLAVIEGADPVLEFGRRHLAVRDDEFRLRHLLAQERRHLVDILDARADIKTLAAAIAFAQQGLAHDQLVERRDEGAHREPVDRRRGDDREFAHARHSELQGARDRRRRQRQHMHLGAQLLQALLVLDAEMLLLVDDDEAEVLEVDGLAEHRMGADDDIDAPWRAPVLAVLRSAALTMRDICAMWTGRPAKRARNVLKCWRASSVVGTTTATCLPLIAAAKAARSATSVLPKPTSPQTSRSIGRPVPRSSSTASMAFADPPSHHRESRAQNSS